MRKSVGVLFLLFLAFGFAGCAENEEQVNVSEELQRCGVEAVEAVDQFLDEGNTSDDAERGKVLLVLDENYRKAEDLNYRWKTDEKNGDDYKRYSAIPDDISMLIDSINELYTKSILDDDVSDVRENRNRLAECLDIGPLTEKEEESLSADSTEIIFGDMLDAFQGEWKDTNSEYRRLIISGETVNFVHEMEIGGKETCDVYTFYFGFDDEENLVVNNSYSQPRHTISLDENGILTIGGIPDADDIETYEKISNNTEVPVTKVEPAVGMTESEVYESTWGHPKDKNKTSTINGEWEQWIYEFGYIYMENGYVTAIQER